jgi:DNA helicase HerA-like ATPase
VERSVGRLLGALQPDGSVDGSAREAFAEAWVDAASAEVYEAMQSGVGADLEIGHWASAAVRVPARLRAQGFTRHTFLCGQSGSGKTYALGVLLEQLLLGTELRMVVLDPNADYVGLGTARADAPSEVAERLAGTDIRILGADSKGVDPLRMRFATMPVQAQAAVLRLDPLADRDEYNRFLHLIDDQQPVDLQALLGALRTEGEHSQALAQRIENLGLPTWEVWAGASSSAAEVVASGPRMTVLDLSGFGDPQEPLAACLDLVERLWLQRETRTPTLIVIDEAHNICPAEPGGSIQAALVERLIQIAAEGRKYGLWLLLSTQRPSKIHPQVLSQCDNLLLMRMNSPGDLAELSEAFGFAPPALLGLSPFFVQGEALVAGGFVPMPAVIRMGDRLTVEGGSDLAVPAP